MLPDPYDTSAPTLGCYLKQPHVAAARAERAEAARWRWQRRLHDTGLRFPLEHALLAVAQGVDKGRRLDAIARDLRLLADRCDHAQDDLDHELMLAVLADEHDQEQLAS